MSKFPVDRLVRLARGGPSWILPPAIVALLLLLSAWRFESLVPAFLAVPFVGVALFFTWFFRDPERVVSPGLVSPADGRVTRIDRVRDPDLGEADRICIFMSPVDVHVNRFPVGGQVKRVLHIDGTHVPAFDKDSDANERVETLIATPGGPVKVVQIAGTVARRIVPYIVTGEGAAKGSRMGLIRFGSRCDVLLQAGRVSWRVKVGAKVVAGTTTIADLGGAL